MTPRCILCKTEDKVRLIRKDFCGIKYVGVDGKEEEIRTDRAYDIYHCDVCDSRFVYPYSIIDYEAAYTKTDIYEGLIDLAHKLKNDPDPWWVLIGRGQQYYAAFDAVKGKANLVGMDVGCGYGYMTIALNTLGHKFMGIEVSKSVVDACNELYSGGFYLADVENLKIDVKLDCIVSLEVIEHLSFPLKFMQSLKSLLKPDGFIVVTTPDRAYFEFRKTLDLGWQGEMPPIHQAIYSKDSMHWLANDLEMDLKFTDFPGGPAQTIGAIFTNKTRRK